MGRPKALLKAGDETFLERAVAVLAAGGCAEVAVVLNDEPVAFLLQLQTNGYLGRLGVFGDVVQGFQRQVVQFHFHGGRQFSFSSHPWFSHRSFPAARAFK